MDCTCHRCIYASDHAARAWPNPLLGWPITLTCVNCAGYEGFLREVMPNGTCRHFCPKGATIRPGKPPAPENDELRYIPLTRGLFAIVDAADYEWLSRHRWTAQGGGKPYACRRPTTGTIWMHRLIMQAPDGMVVDHIDGNSLNNRRSNLRICTPRQNTANRAKTRNGTSRFKGVHFCTRDRKWRAQIGVDGERRFIGDFDDEVEAARAYDRKAAELFGEFAYLNFPQEAG